MTHKEQLEAVKQLRELTGRGLMACKRAMERNNWDKDKAYEYLKQVPLPRWLTQTK